MMDNLVKQSLAGLRVLLVLTALLGVLYPLSVWGVSRLPGLHANAEAVDTTLIGVDPAGDEWFHTRPSAATLPASGGSNKGSLNADHDQVVTERRLVVARREGVAPEQVPPDAVTASASGLDPDITPAYAELQVPRIARVRHLAEDRVRELVRESTSRGIGDPAVNVMALNRALGAAS